MTSFLNNNLSIDRNKLKYSIFYFPGTGGHIVSWLLALAHDYRLLPEALKCFPLELKNNHKTIRNEENIPTSGWSFHENVQPNNPYCKICFLHTSHLDGYRNLYNMYKVIKLAKKHTICVSILMSINARTRSCFEKGTRPFRTYDKITIKTTKIEKEIYRENQLKIIKEFDNIDYFFNYNSLFYSPERYIGEIETIINHPLTDANTEAIEKLVNRYVQITPPKLLKIINDENKLS
jgi:hypothetical protein